MVNSVDGPSLNPYLQQLGTFIYSHCLTSVRRRASYTRAPGLAARCRLPVYMNTCLKHWG